MKIEKERLDVLLVELGIAASRSIAQAQIIAGEVLVDGQPAIKPGMKFPRQASIELKYPQPYVGRGGYKLAAALDSFSIDVAGSVCADVGASTGGFTDVLLQRGASRVYAIDVGYGQLDWKLRTDERVIVWERTNARYLESLPEKVVFATVDVSFISLRLLLPNIRNWLEEKGQIIALIKPQFEAGREKVEKGGVVRSQAVQKQVIREMFSWSEANGLVPVGLIPSPIKGAAGNREFLLHLTLHGDRVMDSEEAIANCF